MSGVPQRSFPVLLQLNVTVPSDALFREGDPVTMNVDGVNAQTGVTMAIK